MDKIKKTKTTAPKKTSVPYKFELHSRVKYVGGLWDDLKGKEAEVIARYNKKCKITYDLKFLHDDSVHHCFGEAVLVEAPMEGQITIEDYEKENT